MQKVHKSTVETCLARPCLQTPTRIATLDTPPISRGSTKLWLCFVVFDLPANPTPFLPNKNAKAHKISAWLEASPPISRGCRKFKLELFFAFLSQNPCEIHAKIGKKVQKVHKIGAQPRNFANPSPKTRHPRRSFAACVRVCM